MADLSMWESRDWHSDECINDWIRFDQTRREERLSWLQTLVGLIPFEHDQVIRVLDIGTGYGILSRLVLEAFPSARVTGQDFSEAMLTQARETLKDYAAQVSLVKSDFASPDWTKELGGPYDAVVASIAIHHARAAERIRSIYREIFPLVGRGGCFLNADYFGPVGDYSGYFYLRSRLLEKQQQARIEQGVDKSLEQIEKEWRQKREAKGYGPSDISTLVGSKSGYCSLESHLLWLREAGFDEVDCFWKNMRKTIVGGYRRPE